MWFSFFFILFPCYREALVSVNCKRLWHLSCVLHLVLAKRSCCICKINCIHSKLSSVISCKEFYIFMKSILKLKAWCRDVIACLLTNEFTLWDFKKWSVLGPVAFLMETGKFSAKLHKRTFVRFSSCPAVLKYSLFVTRYYNYMCSIYSVYIRYIRIS